MGKREATFGRIGVPTDAVDGRGSPIPPDATAYLGSIARKYQDTTTGYQLNSFRERETTRGYFEEFRRSRFFRRQVYPAAVAEAKRTEEPPKLLTEEEYGHKFAGYLFEQMTYADMVGWSMGRNKVVLSPQEVFDLYRILYPNNPVIEGHFGQKFVEGVYQPDGLVINPRTLEVEEALEYKLFNGQEDFESQYGGFAKQKFRSQRKLFRNTRFSMVTPSDFRRKPYHNRPGIGFEVVPVTNGEFGEFVQDTYLCYLNGGGVSLVEMISQRDATSAGTAPVAMHPGQVVTLP